MSNKRRMPTQLVASKKVTKVNQKKVAKGVERRKTQSQMNQMQVRKI